MQVVAEAADACVRALLYYCPTAKVVPLICETLLKDKNPKIRQHCAVYVLQVSTKGKMVAGQQCMGAGFVCPMWIVRAIDAIQQAMLCAMQWIYS